MAKELQGERRFSGCEIVGCGAQSRRHWIFSYPVRGKLKKILQIL